MAETQPIADGMPTTSIAARKAFPDWLRPAALLSVLSTIFGADIRSLGAFRIVLGVVVLIDVASRWSEIRIHYSDEGILPRDDAIVGINDWRWSLLFVNGTEV